MLNTIYHVAEVKRDTLSNTKNPKNTLSLVKKNDEEISGYALVTQNVDELKDITSSVKADHP